MLQGTDGTVTRARLLRGDMSLPEVLLWKQLRANPQGIRFRRQHPSGPFIADFFCHKAKLVVEVDGMTHDCGNRPEQDASRDEWFANRGIAVLRVPASDVLRDSVGTAEGIIMIAIDRALSATSTSITQSEAF